MPVASQGRGLLATHAVAWPLLLVFGVMLAQSKRGDALLTLKGLKCPFGVACAVVNGRAALLVKCFCFSVHDFVILLVFRRMSMRNESRQTTIENGDNCIYDTECY